MSSSFFLLTEVFNATLLSVQNRRLYLSAPGENGTFCFQEAAFKVSKHVHNIGCADHDGLCFMFLNANTGQFRCEISDGFTVIPLMVRAFSTITVVSLKLEPLLRLEPELIATTSIC